MFLVDYFTQDVANNQVLEMNTIHDNWTDRSDPWLVAALRSGEPEAQNRALEVLQQRYNQKLVQRVRRKLPRDWVDEVVQEIWMGFFRSAMREGQEIASVGDYLFGIASRQLADAVERLARERSIEYDLTPPEGEHEFAVGAVESGEESLLRQEEQVVKKIQRNFLELVPFLDGVLSDCQRVLWSLVRVHGYSQKVVSRLMGKKYSTVRSEYRHARQTLVRYLQSEPFEDMFAFPELPESLKFTPQREASVVVERFAEMIIPQLTVDELEPLGLTPKEFEANYVASLIVPRWYTSEGELQFNLPSLLLTQRAQWPDLGVTLQKLSKGSKDTTYIPLECLINFAVEDDQILLKPESLVEILPDLDPPDFSDNTYLAAHQPRMTVPVIWGFWDESMATEKEVEQEYQRWQFMRSGG